MHFLHRPMTDGESLNVAAQLPWFPLEIKCHTMKHFTKFMTAAKLSKNFSVAEEQVKRGQRFRGQMEKVFN